MKFISRYTHGENKTLIFKKFQSDLNVEKNNTNFSGFMPKCRTT